MPIQNPEVLIESLCQYSDEQEWFEFKENYASPEKLGRYISALANGAILKQRTSAYIVFGIQDATHNIVGTTFSLKQAKKGKEPLEFWLKKSLNPDVNFESFSHEIDGKTVEIIHIIPPYFAPVKFNGIPYIRIGETTPALSEYSEKERKIWEIVGRYKFETSTLIEGASKENILEKFRAKALLEKMGTNPSDHTAVVNKLELEKLLRQNDEQGYDVSALLAILCANDFSEFSSLERKGTRLIVYGGESKLHSSSEAQGVLGYCLGFENLIERIMSHIPSKEIIGAGMRQTEYDIPDVAIREIVANAMIHQDFTINGAGPVVEVFADRVKVTNPGSPLVEPERFIDAPSRSRNDRLANFMRRMGYCEERGSGVDRAINAIEKAGLPAPLFRRLGASTEVTLFGPMEFSKMTKEDRVRACFSTQL